MNWVEFMGFVCYLSLVGCVIAVKIFRKVQLSNRFRDEVERIKFGFYFCCFHLSTVVDHNPVLFSPFYQLA